MKSLSILAVALALFAAGCGSDNSTPTTPSNPTTAVFSATLASSNEVAPNAVPPGDPEANGSGRATITMHLTRDATGNITAATTDFSVTYSGFPPGTILTLSHIHEAAAGVNGNVVVNTAIASGEVTFPQGSGSLVKNGVATMPDVATRIMANPAGFYFNSHTAAHPGGVVRGQLSQTSAS